MLDTNYLKAIIDYEINIEFCDKIVWLRPRTEGLSFLSEDTGIKLKDVGGDKMEAVKMGIDKILGSKQNVCNFLLYETYGNNTMSNEQNESDAKAHPVHTLVMFRADDEKQIPIKVECHNGLWPAYDADGIQIYSNTHFELESDAWKRIYDNAKAWVSLAGRSVTQAENSLAEARVEAGEAAKRFLQVTENMRRAQT